MQCSKKKLKRIKAISDSDIDYSDIPRLEKWFWENAKLNMPRPKTAISLRVDQDVLDWFKAQGSGYQSRINAVLRSFMNARKGKNQARNA